MKKIQLFLSASVIGLALLQSAHANDPETEKIKKMLAKQIDGAKKLPMQGLTMIEAQGKTFYVSDNGRIVITGKMYDMWNGVELKSVADVEKYGMRIDLSKLGVNVADLGAINIGQGKKEIVAFVDPNSPASHKFVQAAARLNQFTFRLIMIPGGDEESVEKVKKAACVESKAQVGKALIDNNWDKLLSDVKECDRLPLSKAIITSRVFGIDSRQLPFVIRHDGYVRFGVIKGLDDWLSEVEDKSDKLVDKLADKPNGSKR